MERDLCRRDAGHCAAIVARRGEAAALCLLQHQSAACLAFPAFAQQGWTLRQSGGTTYIEGTGTNQGWTATERTIDGTRYQEFRGPGGEHQICTSRAIGGTKECH